jgi:hypothetical protein
VSQAEQGIGEWGQCRRGVVVKGQTRVVLAGGDDFTGPRKQLGVGPDSWWPNLSCVVPAQMLLP